MLNVEEILDQINKWSEKCFKQDTYFIVVNAKTYEWLKKEAIYAEDNINSYLVNFQNQPIRVILDKYNPNKLTLWKNNHPFITITENGDTYKRCESDEELFYYKNRGKTVTYKDILVGKVAGYVKHYVIIGFDHDNGCIKEFSDHVTYDKGYPSYRFSKLKHLKLK